MDEKHRLEEGSEGLSATPHDNKMVEGQARKEGGKDISRYLELCEEVIQAKTTGAEVNEASIVSLLEKGVFLIKRILLKDHAKKLVIIKKMIHSNVRLLRSEILDKNSEHLVVATAHCIRLLASIEWNEIHADSIILQENMPAEVGSMFKKNKPVEVDGSAKQTSVYDCAIIVKALRSVLKICSELFQRKDLLYSQELASALLELLESAQPDANVKGINGTQTLKLEYLQIQELVARAVKDMTIHENYKNVQSSLFEVLRTKLKVAYQFCVLFDDQRDLGRHEVCCQWLVNVVACYRNITHSSGFQDSVVDSKFLDFLFVMIHRLPLVKELLYNCLRILSKLSSTESFCNHLSSNQQQLDEIIEVLQQYKENNFVVMRVSYILANLTAYREDVAVYVYFHDNGAIFGAFEHFISKTKNEDDYYESMIKSFAEFDFLNQDDKKVLNKIIRLMANIFTVEEPAINFINERFVQYKHLLKKLKYFMTESEVGSNSELLISVLNCISNILFYDKPNLTQNDFEMTNLKQDLTSAVAYIMLQPKDEEILTEGLRVISNLSRSKAGIRNLLKIKFHEAIQVLLKHRSRDVIFYSIGILINLSIDKVVSSLTKEFKESGSCRDLFCSLIELLEECSIDDIEIIGCALKALTNIISENLRNNDDQMSTMFTRLDKILSIFGEECDLILASQEISPEEAADISSLRSIINTVVNICPEEEYECTYKACLRKFKSKDQLQQHILKRHSK